MIQTSLLPSTHGDLVTDAAYDFYGLRLATCSLDQRIKTWTLDETTGNWASDDDWKAHDAPVCRLSWAHPEYGTILASCSFDKTVKIWEEGGVEPARGSDANAGSRWRERATLSESRTTGASVRAVEFAPRQFGLKLAVLSSDSILRIYDCVELHNLATWNLTFTIDVRLLQPPSTPPMSTTDMFAAPGTSLGASSNGKSYGSSVTGGRPGKREADGGWSISWCKDATTGQLIAVAADTYGLVRVLQLSDSRSHKTVFTLPPNASGATDSPAITTVAWAPLCGRRFHLIATGGREGKVNIWKISPPHTNVTTEWSVNLAGTFDDHQSAVTRVEWNVTGTILSSAGNDGNIRLWRSTYGGIWRTMGHIHTEHGDDEEMHE
ncbi:Nucleoporin seh1-A AltName: Full=Nup107-160 subcomplex subunit seh1-A [Serendipita indica DSM 11827]|nr:Nucleoporin seh1-A AltName: Full=Nup107-160 subcomplex subunit seh1-A [Serendipita indica DSM 11827]